MADRNRDRGRETPPIKSDEYALCTWLVTDCQCILLKSKNRTFYPV